VHPTFGPIGGEKSLKSYVLTSITLGLATGVPIFDHFKVDEPAPVVVYVGEGGRLPYTRRLKRIASAMGVTWPMCRCSARSTWRRSAPSGSPSRWSAT
jgi:AAA domain